jgi:hypothetical protein
MTLTKSALAVTILCAGVAVASCASHRENAPPTAAALEDKTVTFGGQPKDQETRERHHPQYPDSAQHLGPHEDQAATNASEKSAGDQSEQERAAVSGVGR